MLEMSGLLSEESLFCVLHNCDICIKRLDVINRIKEIYYVIILLQSFHLLSLGVSVGVRGGWLIVANISCFVANLKETL